MPNKNIKSRAKPSKPARKPQPAPEGKYLGTRTERRVVHGRNAVHAGKNAGKRVVTAEVSAYEMPLNDPKNRTK